MTRLKSTATAALLIATIGALPLCAAEYVRGPDSLMLEVRETVVVDTGFLYLHGHPIEPPYVFEIAGDSLYAELYVNDYIAQVIDRRRPDPESLSPRVRLDYEVVDLMTRMRRAGASVMERTEAAAELYRQHPEIAESVAIDSPGNLSIVFPGSRAYPNPIPVCVASGRTPKTPPTAYSLVKGSRDDMLRGLRTGKIVTYWGGSLGYYPAHKDSSTSYWLKHRPDWVQERYENPAPLETRRR